MDDISEIKLRLTLLRKTEPSIRGTPGLISQIAALQALSLWELQRFPGEVSRVPWLCCVAGEGGF